MFRSCFLIVMLLAFFLAATSPRPPFAAASSPLAALSVETGIDVLEAENFAPLRGMRVGIITNQTGVDSRGRRTIDVLARAPGVKLVAIFSPEHGIAGRIDADVPNSADPATHLPIFSLYGETRRPTPEMLRNLDALVYDIQDAGVRFYTFITTMGYSLEAAAQNHIAFFVLDRPDPLGGEIIEGPMLDPARTSFTAYFPLPIRYAMTPGELARMFNAVNRLHANLHVIALKNWRRSEFYASTGLPFIPPSPNLRTMNEDFLYPGLEILQAGGVSVGRGTGTPFEILGAPWIRGGELAAELDRRHIPGVRFSPARFTPDADLYQGQSCEGVSVSLTSPADFRSMRMGLEIAAALHRLYPDSFHLDKTILLLGSQSTVDQLERGVPVSEILAGWAPALAQFRVLRAKYLLYN
ncbi:MAG TPA: DUF1343 domain-containing protein [Verrucomicrobiae bacterium]|nr:DUF1343 domain-containing protein [Verrucomicrobiae bacterium]